LILLISVGTQKKKLEFHKHAASFPYCLRTYKTRKYIIFFAIWDQRVSVIPKWTQTARVPSQFNVQTNRHSRLFTPIPN